MHNTDYKIVNMKTICRFVFREILYKYKCSSGPYICYKSDATAMTILTQLNE